MTTKADVAKDETRGPHWFGRWSITAVAFDIISFPFYILIRFWWVWLLWAIADAYVRGQGT